MKDKIHKIKKWLVRGKNVRTKVLKQVPKNAICAEIGSWKGDFASKILNETSPAKLFLIDPYKYYPQYKRGWFGGASGSQENMDKVYLGVEKRFQKHIEQNQLEIVREESVKAFERFKDSFFDWIYIDGNHEYEFVLNDLKKYFFKVKPGGLILGDDYGTEGWWKDGVSKAVNEFVKLDKYKISKFEIHKSQFIIQKAE